MIKLIYGDCLEMLPHVPDKFINFICVDLPYGVTANTWDVVIPYNLLWKEFKRIIAPKGVIALFAQNKFLAHTILSNESWFKYFWTWEKTNPRGFLNANRRPLMCQEQIAIFYNGKSNYYPQKTKGVPYVTKNHTGIGSNYRAVARIPTINTGDRYPRDVIKFKPTCYKGEKHPTQKPAELLEYLVKTYTLENDFVLDCCMGSGSLGVACSKLNRNFIGIEKELQYYQLAMRNIFGKESYEHSYSEDKTEHEDSSCLG